MVELFIQSPPQLGNQYTDDLFLRHYLQRVVPSAVLREIEPQLQAMGDLAGGSLYALQLTDRLHEPRLMQWDAWGNRIDEVELTSLWQRCARLAAEQGLVALPYEQAHGAHSRIHQFALVYLFHPSSDFYTCPLAMSDGAACCLRESGNQSLITRAVPRLISRDTDHAWTSGQWMTEASGGSDVGSARTCAVKQPDGSWRLCGKKWFTSAVNAEMALTLARPEGNGLGGQGLALFYLETRDAAGRLNGIRIERLKDKLGTRKVPTAELLLEACEAQLVGEMQGGTRAIEPMLMVTRVWNAISAAACMRRGMALAQSYARQRSAFGKYLHELPLHADILATLEAETRAATLLAFETVRLLGLKEAHEITTAQRALLRLLTPIAKLVTARQAVAVLSEIIECFGGAGYVEDTGLPALLRDAHVLPIWEGTTNVLALDALLRSDAQSGMHALLERAEHIVGNTTDSHLQAIAMMARTVLIHARQWLTHTQDMTVVQAGGRRWALSLGRAFALLLLVEQAQSDWVQRQDAAAILSAKKFAESFAGMAAQVG
ncbi:MAG: acyl-CoA dehydrogenase family protein [Steroidobacteraceae bacterium]